MLHWNSPFGVGYPGWHIECAAMSIKYLGETFDIHGGGMDLLFPHHENELAQSECATGKPFVKYWMHNGLTRVKTKAASGEWKDEKESKSLGNVRDARQMISTLGPDLVRYLLLSTHYRSPIDSGEEVIASSRKGLATFHRLFERVERLTGQPLPEKGIDMDAASRELLEVPAVAEFCRTMLSFKMKFLEMMDDDFNTAGAIAVLHEVAGGADGLVGQAGVEGAGNAEGVGASSESRASV